MPTTPIDRLAEKRVDLTPPPEEPVRDRPWVIGQIRSLADDGKPPAFKDDPALSARAVSLFGTWNAAIEAAGFPPNNQPGEHAADTRESIIRELQARAIDGVPPSSKTDQRFSQRAIKLFGSWNTAVAAAGLTPRVVTKKAAPPVLRAVEELETREEPEGPPEPPVAPEPAPVAAPKVEEPQADPAPPGLPSFAAIAAELEAAHAAVLAADERVNAARRQLIQHPVFEYVWEIYSWDDDGKPMTVEKALRLAVGLLHEPPAEESP